MSNEIEKQVSRLVDEQDEEPIPQRRAQPSGGIDELKRDIVANAEDMEEPDNVSRAQAATTVEELATIAADLAWDVPSFLRRCNQTLPGMPEDDHPYILTAMTLATKFGVTPGVFTGWST